MKNVDFESTSVWTAWSITRSASEATSFVSPSARSVCLAGASG